MALPGQGKNLEAFQQDDAVCRQYAWQQTGGAAPGAAASQSAVGSAVVGTALGRRRGCRDRRGERGGRSGCRDRRRRGPAGRQCNRCQQRRCDLRRRSAALRHQLQPVHDRARQQRAGTANYARLSVPQLSYPIPMPHTPTRMRAFTERRCSRHQSPSALAADGDGAEAGVAARLGRRTRLGRARSAGITDTNPIASCRAWSCRPSHRGLPTPHRPCVAPSPSR